MYTAGISVNLFQKYRGHQLKAIPDEEVVHRLKISVNLCLIEQRSAKKNPRPNKT